MNALFTGLAIQKKRTNLSPDDVATYYNVTIEQHDNDTVASLKYSTFYNNYCKTFYIFV